MTTEAGENQTPEELPSSPGRSMFDFEEEELRAVIEADTWPEGTTMAGMEDQENWESFWRLRANPKGLALKILKTKFKSVSVPDPKNLELRARRLELKQLELTLKAERTENFKEQLRRIWLKLDEMETMLRVVLRACTTGFKKGGDK